MKFNKYFMLGLAGLAFAACSNDEDITNGREDGKVRITLSVGKTETRSLSTSAEGLCNKITDLEIHFYNGSGVYVAYPAKGEVGGVTYDNLKAITDAVDGLNSGKTSHTVELKDIPASATQIYVVANGKNKSNQVGITSLTEARKTPIYLRNQVLPKAVNNGDGLTIDHAFEVFSGEESRLTGLTEAIPANGEVKVVLRPVPSRIEMANVTAVPMELADGETWNGADIQSFTVTGFYINKFYTTGALDPTYNDEITDRSRVDFSNIADNYSKAKYRVPTQEGIEGNWGFMCDEPAAGELTYAAGDGTNTIYSATPTTASHWFGFMALQGNIVDVIVKLNVTYVDKANNTTLPNQTKFLTITSYTYAEATTDDFEGNHAAGTSVGSFLRGHVYKISNIKFNVSNLTDAPYETTKSISAAVEVRPWKGVGVDPGFN